MEQVLKQEMEQLQAYTREERLTNGSLSNVMTGLKGLLESVRILGTEWYSSECPHVLGSIFCA
jgi:hypothetical protein